MTWLKAISDIKDKRVFSGGPDFAYSLCTRRIKPKMRETLDLSNWHLAFTGAEPIRAQTLEAFAQAFAPRGFRRQAFFPCYGLAEATLFVTGSNTHKPPTLHNVDRQALDGHRARTAPAETAESTSIIGCGAPQADQNLVVVDPESHTRCDDGHVGEIWLASPSLSLIHI